MTSMRRARARTGFTLVEVMVGMTLIALVSLVAISHLNTGWRQSEQNRDRLIAYERAQSILEELRAFAETGESAEAAQLDQFDDGVGLSYALTTRRKAPPDGALLVDPDDVVSRNTRSNGQWRFARRITIRRFPGVDTRDLRIVTVRIFLNAGSPNPPGTEIANVSSVIRTISDALPPTQVYDVYFVAIENTPGWWVYMDTIRPFVQAALTDLTARNPGLRVRTHWITKNAYGRNPQYTPFFNESTTTTDPIGSVYFYPSRLPAGLSAVRYYVPDNVRARINVDGEVRNGWDATSNPWPYTLADQYNHAMRLPDEEALFAARVAVGLEREEEPTWRLLLERMNTNPAAFRNAIIVNLHGELLPMPPLRNFSDAAKDPEGNANVRVVTHPEKIRFARGVTPPTTEDVRLRVYTYKVVPEAGPGRLDVPVIVEIPGLDLTANVNGTPGTRTLTVQRVRGGIDIEAPLGADPYQAPADAPVVVGTGPFLPAVAGDMYARVRYDAVRGATVVELHGSPLVTPVVGTQGLDVTRRLYGMEYVPCPTEAAADFSTHLATAGTIEKNTARWVLTIHKESLGGADRRIGVATRIGRGDGGDAAPDSAAFATGIMYPPLARSQPENVSTTYCWWAASANAVPATERFQFQGDPRHCPYADLRAGGSFPHGYNWYFDDLQAGSNNAIARWPGLDAARIKNDGSATNDGWEGRLEVDAPRLFQLLRGALTSSEAVYTTLTGFSYYYMGLGNEIGYDSANGFPNSIPVSGQPFGAAGTGFEQSIINSGGTWGSGVKYVRSNSGGTYWWGMPWLGELYPDGEYAASWRVPRWEYADNLPLPAPLPAPRGNLPAGTAVGEYRRVSRSTIGVNLPFGTALRPAERRTAAEGSTSLFNIGAASTTVFHHQFQDGTFGNLTAAGAEVGTDFRFPLPRSTRVSRPFRLATDNAGGVGDEFAFTTEYPRHTAQLRTVYYTHPTGATSSALVQLSPPVGSSAYVVVNGIDRTTESGSAFIGRYAMLTLVHGFLSAGDPALPQPIAMRPRVQITAPTATTELVDPATITITWNTAWRRWDGLPYTASYPVGFAPTESTVEYVLLYSLDNGATWRHMVDGSDATPGVLPAAGLRQADANDPGDESFDWAVPAGSFPKGTYRIRVEAYRTGAQQHYSFHEEMVFIGR